MKVIWLGEIWEASQLTEDKFDRLLLRQPNYEVKLTKDGKEAVAPLNEIWVRADLKTERQVV